MLLKTEAIVLRTIKFSETSIVAQLFTREKGACSILVKGARSAGKKNTAAIFQPLVLLELDIYWKENAQLNNYKEAQARPVLPGFNSFSTHSAVQPFLAELIYKSLRDSPPDEEVFDDVKKQIILFHHTEKAHIPFFLSHFTLSVIKNLGFSIEPVTYKPNYSLDLDDGIFKRLDEAKSTSVGVEISELIYKMLIGEKVDENNPRNYLFMINELLTFLKTHHSNFHEIQTKSLMIDALT